MAEALPIERLLGTLRDLSAWLDETNVSGVIVGGVAASILGRPRATRDVDAVVLIEEERWAEFVNDGKPFGFLPRRPDCLEFAARTRVLLLRHTPSGVDVDISLGAIAFEVDMIARRQVVDSGGVRISLPTVEDLIAMKAIARRARDIADIESILDANPDVDRAHVRALVTGLAADLDAPDIVDKLDQIMPLTAARRQRR